MSDNLLYALFVAGLSSVGAYFFVSAMGQTIEDARGEQLRESGGSLGELYIGLSGETFLLLRGGLTLVMFILGFMAVNVFSGAFLAAFGWIGPGWLLKRMKEKRVQLCEQQLIEALELMSNSIKSGLTLPQACELLTKEFPPPISQEFSLLLAESRLGVEFNDGLQNMAERLNSIVFHILATGVAITKRCGGDMTVIFANIAQTIRDQGTIEGKLNAVTAQGRFQGVILSVMPFALIVILWFVDPSHVETLFGFKIGLWALALVVVLVIMAQAWIQKLMTIDV